MACIPDFLGKMLLKKYDFHIPKGVVIGSINEAEQTKRLNLPLLITPYYPYDPSCHASEQYKAFSYKEVQDICDYLLRSFAGKEMVSRVYVEEEIRGSLGHRLVIRLTVDGLPVAALFKAEQEEPAATWEIDYLQGFPLWAAEEFLQKAGFDDEKIPILTLFVARCYKIFVTLQLTHLDLGDFCLMDDEIIVKSVHMNVDDLVMTGDFEPLHVEGMNMHLPRRMLTPSEQNVAEINEKERNRGWVHFIQLPENDDGVAVCFGGTGLSLMMTDFLHQKGIVPVNLTDLSSGVSEKKLVVLLTAILQRPKLKMFLMVINFFQFSRVDVYASALVTVLKKLGIDPVQFPIVVRLTGPGAKGAHEILSSVPGIHFYTDDLPFEEIERLTLSISRGGVG